MFSHTITIRVRYSETDQMGFVYYGQYAAYFEVGRVETMRALGLSYASLEKDHGVFLPVVNAQMRFVRPAQYDDELKVVTEIRSLPDSQIVFHTEIFKPNGKLATAGRITLCALDAETYQRIPIPSFISEKLEAHIGNQEA